MRTLVEICNKCGREMMLLGSEEHAEKPGVIFHTYECSNCHTLVLEEPNNGKAKDVLNGDGDSESEA